MKICNNCKTKNDDAAKFCRSCGKLLDVQEELASTKTESTNSGSSSKVIVGILCVIGIVGCIIGILNGAPKYVIIAIGMACVSGLKWAFNG